MRARARRARGPRAAAAAARARAASSRLAPARPPLAPDLRASRSARRRRAERAGHADEVARARAVAPDELLLALGPADDGHRDAQRPARATTSPPAICVPRLDGERRGAAHERERSCFAEPARQPEREVGLARLGAHRREIRQRRRQRAVADLGGARPARAQAEVDVPSTIVSTRDDGEAAARARRRRRRPDPRTTARRPARARALSSASIASIRARSAMANAQRWR